MLARLKLMIQLKPLRPDDWSKRQRDDKETFPILGATDIGQVVLLGDVGRASKAKRKAAKLKGGGQDIKKTYLHLLLREKEDKTQTEGVETQMSVSEWTNKQNTVQPFRRKKIWCVPQHGWTLKTLSDIMARIGQILSDPLTWALIVWIGRK